MSAGIENETFNALAWALSAASMVRPSSFPRHALADPRSEEPANRATTSAAESALSSLTVLRLLK